MLLGLISQRIYPRLGVGGCPPYSTLASHILVKTISSLFVCLFGSHGLVYPPSEARRSWGVYPCGYGRLRRPAVYTSTTQACLCEGHDSARGLGECLGGALPTIFGKITQLHRLPFTGAVGTQVHLCLLYINSESSSGIEPACPPGWILALELEPDTKKGERGTCWTTSSHSGWSTGAYRESKTVW